MSQSPTLTEEMTRAGVILGTAAYMSPEQARGKVVDKRADIWAFGAVLYELLTAKKAFSGEEVPDVLASIMKTEPDWSVIPSDRDPRIQNLLGRCLRKDRKNRLQAIGDARVEIQDILADPHDESAAAAPAPATRRLAIGMAVAVALVVGVVASVVVWILKPDPARSSVRFVANPTSLQPYIFSTDAVVAITPDGSRIVYQGTLNDQSHLFVRRLDELEAMPLAASSRSATPFISPDGNWVGYAHDGTWKKVSIQGGPSVTMGDTFGGPRGASWGSDDTIIFASDNPNSGLWRIPAGGGEPEELTKPDPAQGDHFWPEILPGGEAVLFTLYGGASEISHIMVLSLVTRQTQVLIPGGSNPHYSPTGHIVYGVDGTLRAVRFDLDRLEVTSDPVPVLDGVVTKTSGAAVFSVSLDGTLVYGSGRTGAQNTIVWVDRQGQEELLFDEGGQNIDVRISPDSTKVAVDMLAMGDLFRNIWIYEIDGGRRTRLTTEGGAHSVWTPDGTRVAFNHDVSSSSSGLSWIPADGSGEAERLFEGSSHQERPDAWSPDGRLLAFSDDRQSASGRDIWILPRDGEPSPFLATPYTEDGPMFSPDGRWLAYVSDESGQREVYVQPYPGPGPRHPISAGGGRAPTWSGKGDELFYRSGDSTQMMVVPVETEPEFQAGTPQVLFEGQYRSDQGDAHYDVTPDGQRFLMIKESSGDSGESPPELIVVLNWFEELKRLVPAN
ncbi:MAG: protein kinase [candidate division NC10 bacterium]